jgi:hypothetical protein
LYAWGWIIIPTLDHPSEQKSLAGDTEATKNKYAARVGHPAELFSYTEKRRR